MGLQSLKTRINNLLNSWEKLEAIEKFNALDLKNPKVLQGRMAANLNNHVFKSINRLSDVEFQVYSQFGDDGIIQWLINQVDIPNKTFIEFGVENYTESNTRFLLVNNNWQGLVIDGSKENIDYILGDKICWAHHLFAKASFITKENINELLSNLPFPKEVGILSIDIDGNDWYVWNEINVVNPVIVITEYLAHFKLNPWSVPYKADFVRASEGVKKNYWGVSLQSLVDLGDEKGYYFVGCNSAGNNAYFVRKDKIGNLKPITAEEGYEFAKYRETFNENGERVSDNERLATLNGLPVFNTRTKSIETINV